MILQAAQAEYGYGGHPFFSPALRYGSSRASAIHSSILPVSAYGLEWRKRLALKTTSPNDIKHNLSNYIPFLHTFISAKFYGRDLVIACVYRIPYSFTYSHEDQFKQFNPSGTWLFHLLQFPKWWSLWHSFFLTCSSIYYLWGRNAVQSWEFSRNCESVDMCVKRQLGIYCVL